MSGFSASISGDSIKLSSTWALQGFHFHPHPPLVYGISLDSNMADRLSLVLRLSIALFTALAAANPAAQEPLVQQSGYKVGEPIPVSCLTRAV